jgi:imidazoleglycerol phosphate synthase cyclase subunit
MRTLTTARRIIPCLDMRDSRVVKGVRFEGLRDVGDPATLAARYERDGADEITLLDVSATLESRSALAGVVRDVRRAIGIPLTVGGGVRTLDDATRLLDAGADKVSVNSAAVENPDLLDAMATRFGSQFVVLAVDARRSNDRWHVTTRSGTIATSRDAIEWCAEGASRGAGEILLTSWDRDGTRDGYDIDLLQRASREIDIPIIASGGANGASHMLDAFNAGADAVLAASIFHDGLATIAAIKSELANAGVEVRRC